MASQLLRRMRALFAKKTLTEQEAKTMLQGLQNLIAAVGNLTAKAATTNDRVAALQTQVSALQDQVNTLQGQVGTLQTAQGDDDAVVQAQADAINQVAGTLGLPPAPADAPTS